MGLILDGDISLLLNIDGDASLESIIDGEQDISIITKQYAAPVYTGLLQVTPTAEQQVLQTADHTLVENITINPIPSNYGLITWNGSTLTVS